MFDLNFVFLISCKIHVTAVSCQSKMAAEESMIVDESLNSAETATVPSEIDIFSVEGYYL